jgi:Restriction endonuclease
MGGIFYMASRQESQQQEMELERRNIELTASFAMSPTDAPCFELFSGVHPLEQRHLSEEEEQYPLFLLRSVRREELLSLSSPNTIEQLALLWLKYFPEIDDLFSQYKEWSDFEAALTREALRRIEVLNLAYAFYPIPSSNQFEQYPQIRAMQAQLQYTMEERISNDSRSKGKVTWTLPFPVIGSFGQEVERRAGLSSQLKARLSLNNYTPGLLCNYLLHRGIPMEKVLDPHQFEDFVGLVFQEEGWKTERMPKTHDGGKDIIASKVVNGQPIITYIQAKRYAQGNPVPVKEMREFIFTLASNGLNQGYMVTTSYFTSDAEKLQHTMKVPLATVELIDRNRLETIMQRIGEADIPAYLL